MEMCEIHWKPISNDFDAVATTTTTTTTTSLLNFQWLKNKLYIKLADNDDDMNIYI